MLFAYGFTQPPIIDTQCWGRAGSSVLVPGPGSETRDSIEQPTTRGMTDDECGVSVVGAETLELTQRPGFQWGPCGLSTLGARACRRERVRCGRERVR